MTNGPSETFPGSVLPGSPAGAHYGSHPRGESDPVVTQDFAPAGAALTATEVGRVKLAREYAANGVNVELAKEYLSWLLAIIDRLTASPDRRRRHP